MQELWTIILKIVSQDKGALLGIIGSVFRLAHQIRTSSFSIWIAILDILISTTLGILVYHDLAKVIHTQIVLNFVVITITANSAFVIALLLQPKKLVLVFRIIFFKDKDAYDQYLKDEEYDDDNN